MAMLLTWFPFLYFEMTFRFNHVPQYLLNISRPFAAHWYVCTDRKHHITVTGFGKACEVYTSDFAHFHKIHTQCYTGLGMIKESFFDKPGEFHIYWVFIGISNVVKLYV